MSDQQDDQSNTQFRNPQSPDPMDNSPQGTNVDDTFGAHQSVPSDDIGINPDNELRGYQDDIDTSTDKLDTVQFEQGTSPSNVMQRSPEELKGVMDDAAMDEQEYSPEQHDGKEPNVNDDLRENVEDMGQDGGDESKF